HRLVTAGAERLVPFAGQNDHTHFRVVTSASKGIDHLIDGAGGKSVAHFRTIDGHLGDLIVLLIADLLILAYLFPFHRQSFILLRLQDMSEGSPPGQGRLGSTSDPDNTSIIIDENRSGCST